MKKLFLILGLVFALNGNANPIIKSWDCDGLIVTMHKDYTIKIGDLQYVMIYKDSRLSLSYAGRIMLHIIYNFDGTLTLINSDNENDRKKFISCD